eukprot:9186909-Heterocapsa_arctica.AAC.1
MIRARSSRSHAKSENWPCKTQPCPGCMADLPTGFTVCIRCCSPFIFIDISADANQRVSGVSNAVPAAPAIISG